LKTFNWKYAESELWTNDMEISPGCIRLNRTLFGPKTERKWNRSIDSLYFVTKKVDKFRISWNEWNRVCTPKIIIIIHYLILLNQINYLLNDITAGRSASTVGCHASLWQTKRWKTYRKKAAWNESLFVCTRVHTNKWIY
jgi:hypothetical protein